MKYKTRDRLVMVARPVFILGSIIVLVAEKFLKMMPLTLFWVAIAASLYLNVSLSALFESHSIIRFSMFVNALLAFGVSMKQIGDTIGAYYASKAGAWGAGKGYSRSE